jgi:hypothetical protein
LDQGLLVKDLVDRSMVTHSSTTSIRKSPLSFRTLTHVNCLAPQRG